MPFIIIFCYSAIYFPTVDLLSKDLIVCALIWQAVLYVFYILNFTIFDVKVFIPQETERKDASDKDSINSDSINPVNMNMGILLNVLLCEIVVFTSICMTYIITLYGFGHENHSTVVCYTTWGKHPANIGVGVAILLITLSIYFQHW